MKGRITLEKTEIPEQLRRALLTVLDQSGATCLSDGEGTHRRTPEEWLAYENRRAERSNHDAGDLDQRDGYDCPLCLNRGYFHRVRADGSTYVEECSCMPIRRNRLRLRESGLEDMAARYTFDTWQCVEPWQEEAKAKAQDYADRHQGWFLACGPSGTGKTHLCTAICSRLMEQGMEVRYVLWREFAPEAKAAISDQYEYDRLVSPLKEVPVLYIDDLFKTGKGQEPTAADVNLAFELLNSRYNDSGKLTIISTEKSTSELVDIDEAVGSRIYERSKGVGFQFKGKNWRLKDYGR